MNISQGRVATYCCWGFASATLHIHFNQLQPESFSAGWNMTKHHLLKRKRQQLQPGITGDKNRKLVPTCYQCWYHRSVSFIKWMNSRVKKCTLLLVRFGLNVVLYGHEQGLVTYGASVETYTDWRCCASTDSPDSGEINLIQNKWPTDVKGWAEFCSRYTLKLILSLQQQYWTKSLHFFFSWFSIDLYWMVEVSLDSLIKLLKG